jgi:hypothetical protein
MNIRTIRISGPFTDDEFGEFVMLLRRIDQANPTGIYKFDIIDADGTMDAGKRMIRTLLPPLPDRATAFARAAYRDDHFPERNCDRCGKPYRGPAVYCSLDCALADA